MKVPMPRRTSRVLALAVLAVAALPPQARPAGPRPDWIEQRGGAFETPSPGFRGVGAGETRPDALVLALADLAKALNRYATRLHKSARPSKQEDFDRWRFGPVLVASVCRTHASESRGSKAYQVSACANKVELESGSKSFTIRQHLMSATELSEGPAPGSSDEARLELHAKDQSLHGLIAELKAAGVRFQDFEEDDDVYMLASLDLTPELRRELQRLSDPGKFTPSELAADRKVYDELASTPGILSAADQEDEAKELDPKMADFLRRQAEKDFDELAADAEDEAKPSSKVAPAKGLKPKTPDR